MGITINGSSAAGTISLGSNGTITNLATGGLPDGSVNNADLATDVATALQYDDTKLRRDLNILALHTAVDNNKTAHNLNNTFIENFQDDSALETQTTVDRNTAGEYVSSIVTGSQTLISNSAGTIIGDFDHQQSVAFDGSAHVSASSSAQKQGSQGSAWLGKDWGAGNEKKINGFKVFSTTDDGIHGGNANTSGCTLKLYGHTSNDIGASSDLGGLTNQNFKLNNHTYTVLSGLTDTTAYRYHWIFHSIGSGTASTFYNSEVEFFENPITVNATGTLISTAQTATDARTKVSGCILYEDSAGTATLGTDLKVSFSCNNGSNWTALDATAGNYTAGNTFTTGIKTAHLKEVTCTSGTQIKYKVEWANQAEGSKETRLHGIGVNY